jgi:hypothetical protein
MAWRDLGDNATLHHFVSDFASRPLTDRPLFWLLARQGDNLAGLLGGDLRRSSWTRDIRESLDFLEDQRARLPASQSSASANCEPYPRSLPGLWQSGRSFFPRLQPGSCAHVVPLVEECCVCAQVPPIPFALSPSRSTPLVLVLALILSSFPSGVFPPILPHNYFSLHVLVGRVRLGAPCS